MASTALATIDVPQPPIRPKGVKPQQWRLAVLYPRAKSAYEAMIQAGYAEVTALASAKRSLESVGVRRATEAIAAAASDRAREIKAFSASRVLAEVKKENGDPNFALNAWATSSKVIVDYPDEVQALGETERDTARDYILGIVESVLLATGVDITQHDVSQLIDNALVTRPASDNGQYVNSALPPTK